MKNLLTTFELPESINPNTRLANTVTVEFCYTHGKEDNALISNAPIANGCKSSNTIRS